MGTMRDLDQIREHDDGGGSSRLMSLALGGLATACVLFAVGVMVGREAGESRTATREDPLARLDQLAQQAEGAQAAMVTYPERLTGAAPAAPTPAVPGTPTAPAVPGAVAMPEGGPVLVAGAALPPAGVRVAGGFGAPSMAPVAGLTGAPGGLAAPAVAPAGPPAAAGSEGAFSVQVSSFRSQQAAQGFAARLRERGHHAFVAAPATAPNGVVWHRVRIGPFPTQREAASYRVTFEARERMPTILVRREQEPLAPVAHHPAAPPAPAAAPLQAAAHAPLVR
ncbi:MAG: SPOR domain-containing protein [Polyangiales bacterium]